jgi:hypothetical protein
MKRISRLCSAGMMGLVVVGTAVGNEEIRQPPSVYPLPRVNHATLFDVETQRPNANFQFPDADAESGVFFRFRDPQQVFSSTETTEFRRTPLRFIQETDPPQDGNSFPSKYLKDEANDEPTPAPAVIEEESSKLWEQRGESRASETAQAGENNGLMETQAVPADAMPPQVNTDTIVEGAGEPTSMPLDAASCTRSLD